MAPMQRSPGQEGKRLQLPSGFRFRPTDEELVAYMRMRRVHGGHITAGIFHEVKLLDYHPRTLIELFDHEGEKKVYLLSSRSRKYPNGDRPCRSAEGGYWKASGKDRPIENKAGQKIGTKRSLSFHEGHQPYGIKTNWLMHEYIIEESHQLPDPSKGCTTLDDWVLFVVYLNGNKEEERKNGSKRINTSALEESSQKNKVAKLRMNAAATGNIDKGKSITVATCTSYGSRESAIYLKNLAAACSGPLSPLRANTEGDHMYASHSSAVDAQWVSALDSRNMEASSMPSSSTQPFLHDNPSYCGMQMDGVGYDYPIAAAPLRAIHARGMEVDQAPQIRCTSGSSAEGTVATTSQTNNVVKLHTEVAATDNTGEGIIVEEPNTAYGSYHEATTYLQNSSEKPSTFYGSHEATTYLQNSFLAGCHEPLTPLIAKLQGDQMYASHLSTMDAHRASSLDSAKKGASRSFEPISFTEPFYYDHLSYYGMQHGTVGCDCPYPLRAKMDQASLIRCTPGSCGQHLEHNHQCQGMKPLAVNCGTNLGMLCPPNREDLLTMAMQGNVQSQNLGFDGWNDTSMNMGAPTSYEPASSAPQPLQYNNYQGDFSMPMDNGATTLQWNGQIQDLPVYGCSSTGLNIGALTRNELALPTPQHLQFGDHLYMQMDNGSNGTDFNGMPPSNEQFWSKLFQDLESDNGVMDPLSEAFLNDILDPNAPYGIGPLDNPPTSQASTGVAEVPQPNIGPETTAAPPHVHRAMAWRFSAKPGIVAPVMPDCAASPLPPQTVDNTKK